jgi:hypothetical protein
MAPPSLRQRHATNVEAMIVNEEELLKSMAPPLPEGFEQLVKRV